MSSSQFRAWSSIDLTHLADLDSLFGLVNPLYTRPIGFALQDAQTIVPQTKGLNLQTPNLTKQCEFSEHSIDPALQAAACAVFASIHIVGE